MANDELGRMQKGTHVACFKGTIPAFAWWY